MKTLDDYIDEDESYTSFLIDNNDEDDDYLLAHDDERIINWDGDEYEFYDQEEYDELTYFNNPL